MPKRAFTLLEMVLVLAVLSFGFFPLVGLFSGGITASSDATNSNIALQLAQQKIEAVKDLPFASIVSAGEGKGSITGFPLFSRTVSVEAAAANLKTVTVTVYWGLGQKAGSLELRTYVVNLI